VSMSCPAPYWVTTMALADLRALARRPAQKPEPVTPVTRCLSNVGNRRDAQKAEGNRQFPGVATRVTGATRGLDNAGIAEQAALANDPAPTEADVSNEPFAWPAPGTAERERLERANAVLCAALREGFHRHRAALAVHSRPTGR